jgi:hypothetical protein
MKNMETNDEYNPGAAHVPPQQTGSEMNAVEKLELSSATEAVYFFKTVKERLVKGLLNHDNPYQSA